MNLQQYTTKAAEAVQTALTLGKTLHHQALAPLHLLLALLEQPEGLVPTILRKLEKDPEKVASDVREVLGKLSEVSGGIAAHAKDRVLQAKLVSDLLMAVFRPEFLNRIDDTIIFQPLSKEHIVKIVAIQMERVQARLVEKGIRLEITKKAAAFLAEKGYDEIYGARPLKRVIQNEILDELSLQILEGKICAGDTVTVDRGELGVAIRKTPRPRKAENAA